MLNNRRVRDNLNRVCGGRNSDNISDNANRGVRGFYHRRTS